MTTSQSEPAEPATESGAEWAGARDFVAAFLYGLVVVAALREARLTAAVVIPIVGSILLGMGYGRWLAPRASPGIAFACASAIFGVGCVVGALLEG